MLAARTRSWRKLIAGTGTAPVWMYKSCTEMEPLDVNVLIKWILFSTCIIDFFPLSAQSSTLQKRGAFWLNLEHYLAASAAARWALKPSNDTGKAVIDEKWGKKSRIWRAQDVDEPWWMHDEPMSKLGHTPPKNLHVEPSTFQCFWCLSVSIQFPSSSFSNRRAFGTFKDCIRWNPWKNPSWFSRGSFVFTTSRGGACCLGRSWYDRFRIERRVTWNAHLLLAFFFREKTRDFMVKDGISHRFGADKFFFGR